ncbi:MAG: hypothetical protein ACD_17C00157G0001 [uncultured bacterium]|nr:MAG: hypothetical protein ACD_17C00157G0001 [uncultured bacterium]
MIPIEHKYDKLFRFYSLSLIPEGLAISSSYEKKFYFYLSDLLALLLLLSGIFWIKIPLRRFFGNFLWPFFGCAFLSIVHSPFLKYPVAYSKLLQLLTPVLLFSFITNAFQPEEKRKLTRLLLIGLFAAGLLQAALGIVQYFHQAPLGLRLLGETNETSIYLIEGGYRWILDELFGNASENSIIMRAKGTLPHANVFGGFLVFSLFASYYLILQDNKRSLAFTLPFQLFALLLSFSRSALFGWGLATVTFLSFLHYKKHPKAVWFSLWVMGSFLFSFTLLFNQYKNRGGVISSTHLSQRADSIRKIQQVTAFEIIQEHPRTGLGFSQFSERSEPFLKTAPNAETRATAPHNIFLFIACEMGIFALVFFLLFLTTLSSFFPSTLESALFGSLLIGYVFIGLCDFYPILFQQGKLMFFFTAALLALHRKRHVVQEDPMENPSRQNIGKMFDRISQTYDRTNRILSLGMDQSWRRALVRHLPEKTNLKILDIATGTGDQAHAFISSKKSIGSITGIDVSPEMLEIAKKKLPSVQFLMANAEKLPFSKERFDAASFSFGIRNVENPIASLEEMFRVLKKNGRCLILEFSLPPKPIRMVYLFYLRRILPFIGGILSKDQEAYRYLNHTIETFPSGRDFCLLMKSVGFSKIKVVSMNLGGVSLYIGDKIG